MKKIAVILTYFIITNCLFGQSINYVLLDSAITKGDKIISTDSRVFFKNVESVIIWADNKILFEKYYHNYNRDSLHRIQSQTKSIVSLLLGIAIDKGYIKNEDDFVKNYFPEYFDPKDKFKSKLTIKHLLTMSAGFEWEEMIPFENPDNDNRKMFQSGRWLDYIFSRPVIVEPFTEFKYNSGYPIIIARIIEKASGLTLDKFAEQHLFKPLDINEYFWLKDSTGLCHAGGGLSMKPIDILKIGVMVLNKGKWNGDQIISENWIAKSVEPYFKTSFDIGEYGYFWWIREMKLKNGKTTKVISAEGAGGQKVYIFPQYQIVAAFTERNYTTPQVGTIFIRESILPVLE
ncbi:MAG: serine hydrolase [Melioribacteraceae bacterium]|nr:serine hydrolase [Melioribacteraceae bacterium]